MKYLKALCVWFVSWFLISFFGGLLLFNFGIGEGVAGPIGFFVGIYLAYINLKKG